jgi:glycosyltransferase involved in cell wall biosynthesis
MPTNLVIIPTYNEKENIENIIRAVFSLELTFHILVVEDGSPDGTAAIVKKMQNEFPERLFIFERQGKLGLGTAYIADLSGRWSMVTNIFLKWMPIFRTTRMIYRVCMMPVLTRVPI